MSWREIKMRWQVCQTQSDTEDELPFLPYCCVYVKMLYIRIRLCVNYRCTDTQKMHMLSSRTTDTTSTYKYTHAHTPTLTYTTNFPRSHISHSFTDSDCATFEKGEWVCWLEISSSDPTQSPLSQDTTLCGAVDSTEELCLKPQHPQSKEAWVAQRLSLGSTAVDWKQGNQLTVHLA